MIYLIHFPPILYLLSWKFHNLRTNFTPRLLFYILILSPYLFYPLLILSSTYFIPLNTFPPYLLFIYLSFLIVPPWQIVLHLPPKNLRELQRTGVSPRFPSAVLLSIPESVQRGVGGENLRQIKRLNNKLPLIKMGAKWLRQGPHKRPAKRGSKGKLKRRKKVQMLLRKIKLQNDFILKNN